MPSLRATLHARDLQYTYSLGCSSFLGLPFGILVITTKTNYNGDYRHRRLLSVPWPGLFPDPQLIVTVDNFGDGTRHLDKFGLLKTRVHYLNGPKHTASIYDSVGIRFDLWATYFLKLPLQSSIGAEVLAGFGL